MGSDSIAYHADATDNSIRYLPTYEDATTQYSLRLPTYRSSYIRRFHPYPRSMARIVERFDMDDDGNETDQVDGETFLDLSVLEGPVPSAPSKEGSTDKGGAEDTAAEKMS
ncbi:hypothetical protein APHAL10511_000921 [Amanita phalloides]|nr:hypothetical protein APHAL10511_000921 [Amanita phalloides]